MSNDEDEHTPPDPPRARRLSGSVPTPDDPDNNEIGSGDDTGRTRLIKEVAAELEKQQSAWEKVGSDVAKYWKYTREILAAGAVIVAGVLYVDHYVQNLVKKSDLEIFGQSVARKSDFDDLKAEVAKMGREVGSLSGDVRKELIENKTAIEGLSDLLKRKGK